jgi:hypothetical protein
MEHNLPWQATRGWRAAFFELRPHSRCVIYWVGGPSPGQWITVSANTPPLGTPHCGICGPPVKIVALDLDDHGDRSDNGQSSDRPSRSRVTALCDRIGF